LSAKSPGYIVCGSGGRKKDGGYWGQGSVGVGAGVVVGVQHQVWQGCVFWCWDN
jgi:hypothetical protein